MVNEIEQEKFKQLHALRRLLKGLLPLLEFELSSYDPKCKECFGSKGLVDSCECGRGRN